MVFLRFLAGFERKVGGFSQFCRAVFGAKPKIALIREVRCEKATLKQKCGFRETGVLLFRNIEGKMEGGKFRPEEVEWVSRSGRREI